MRERPIIFSGEMVKAILDGRKSQTRRVVKTDKPEIAGPLNNGCFVAHRFIGDMEGDWISCPYGVPGDKLWVRETWQKYGDGVAYRASAPFEDNRNWKPSIHMPRWASRITLEITGVRAERLNEISADDVAGEGMPDLIAVGLGATEHFDQFVYLWDSINGKKHPWASNPWVWVIEFRRISDE